MTTSNGTIGSTICDITWTGDPADPQDVRLRAALLDAHRRLSALLNKPKIVEAAGKCLQRANEEAHRPARYVAWDCLHQFDDELLLAMDAQELGARWCTLRAEADEKLKGSWRAKAAEFLIKQAPEGKAVPVSIVRELQAHVATAAQNQQHKLDVFERAMPWLTALLGLAVAASLDFSYIVFSTERLAFLRPWANGLALGVPAGALGGILSMAFSFGRADLRTRIPEIRLSRLVTGTRPLLGATVAIPVLVFIQASYLKFAGFDGPLAIFAFCFLGGFSERWFLGVMERFEAGKK